MGTEVTRIRQADDEHAVISVEGGRGLYRRSPCSGCPWRLDQAGVFPAEAFRLSAETAYDLSDRTFACHETGHELPITCAGFLLRGADDNMAVRMRSISGEWDLSTVHDGGHELHYDYRAMAVANGVDPEDPALRRCR